MSAGSVRPTTDVPGIPENTRDWLTAEENPAVSVLARRALLGEPASAELDRLWARRNTYAPVAQILDLMQPDGSWAPRPRDYQKYWGSLWQIHLLGELYADGDDERVRTAADYAFSRQLPDGSWSCSNMQPHGSLPCLTANIGRALARLGFARDERVAAALGYCVARHQALGVVGCAQMLPYQLNGYCHMLTPKVLLFLAEVPDDLWPAGAGELRDACIAALRDKSVVRSVPAESKAYQTLWAAAPRAEREGLRDRFLAESGPLSYLERPGWLRLGYPLSYNSDALEALWALALHGEPLRPEFERALEIVRSAATPEMRWVMRTSFNGKMLADVETKGEPSRWLTYRALSVLRHFEAS
jgi:hypothetical protein